jgi:hypothetical protein
LETDRDKTARINTAILHRYLHLAQQAREMYMQVAGGFGGTSTKVGLGTSNIKSVELASRFIFDPFRDDRMASENRDNGSSDAANKNSPSKNGGSRFEFARQGVADDNKDSNVDGEFKGEDGRRLQDDFRAMFPNVNISFANAQAAAAFAEEQRGNIFSL